MACRSAQACKKWPDLADAWVHCVPSACIALERTVSRLNGSPAEWGSFKIRFIGRKALTKRPKTFLNDSNDDVLIEKLEAASLIKGKGK